MSEEPTKPVDPANSGPTHPSFPQPPDENIRVWRYLDVAKFIWLLQNQKLLLTRTDLFSDPHEGSIPKMNSKILEKQFLEDLKDADSLRDLIAFRQRLKQFTYVSCWHMNEHESEAMWRLYCGLRDGVAIQTTYQRLKQSLSKPGVHIGLVSYFDFDRDCIPINILYYPFMSKRMAFAHEREVRILKAFLSEAGDMRLKNTPAGFPLPWDVQSVAEAVYVHPYAPTWYFDVITAIVEKFAPKLLDRILWSRLNATPTF